LQVSFEIVCGQLNVGTNSLVNFLKNAIAKNVIFGAPDKTQLAQTGANLRKISGNALATKTWENFKLKFKGEKKINK